MPPAPPRYQRLVIAQGGNCRDGQLPHWACCLDEHIGRDQCDMLRPSGWYYPDPQPPWPLLHGPSTADREEQDHHCIRRCDILALSHSLFFTGRNLQVLAAPRCRVAFTLPPATLGEVRALAVGAAALQKNPKNPTAVSNPSLPFPIRHCNGPSDRCRAGPFGGRAGGCCRR